MSALETNKYKLLFIFKFGNQSVFIMSYIKYYSSISDCIGIFEKLDHLIRALKMHFFDSVVPKFQSRPCIWRFVPKFSKCASGKNSHFVCVKVLKYSRIGKSLFPYRNFNSVYNKKIPRIGLLKAAGRGI